MTNGANAGFPYWQLAPFLGITIAFILGIVLILNMDIPHDRIRETAAQLLMYAVSLYFVSLTIAYRHSRKIYCWGGDQEIDDDTKGRYWWLFQITGGLLGIVAILLAAKAPVAWPIFLWVCFMLLFVGEVMRDDMWFLYRKMREIFKRIFK